MTIHVDALFGPKREVQIHTAKADVSATLTGGGKYSEPVVVWEANNKLEAEIVKGRLESEGIPAIIRGEVLGSIVGLTTGSLAATDVLVPGPLADKALTLLNSEINWEEVDDGTD